MTALVCPNGHRMETTRRGRHMPLCMQCAIDGKGQVAIVPELPLAAVQPHSEPPEPEPEPAMVRAAASSTFKYDCARDGHRFVGLDACGFCGAPSPVDPATGVRSVVAAAVLFAGLSLLAPRCAQAEEWHPPDAWDTALLATAEVLEFVDMGQTVGACRDRFAVTCEGGLGILVLGPHPSTEAIVGWTAGAMAATAALWWVLPDPWRKTFLITLDVTEGANVARNFYVGATFRL